MVWSDRTFNKLSDAAAGMVNPLLKVIFLSLGIELDGVAGLRRLNNLGIRQIITNNYRGEMGNGGVLPIIGNLNVNGTDGVIPNVASLYSRLNLNFCF